MAKAIFPDTSRAAGAATDPRFVLPARSSEPPGHPRRGDATKPALPNCKFMIRGFTWLFRARAGPHHLSHQLGLRLSARRFHVWSGGSRASPRLLPSTSSLPRMTSNRELSFPALTPVVPPPRLSILFPPTSQESYLINYPFSPRYIQLAAFGWITPICT